MNALIMTAVIALVCACLAVVVPFADANHITSKRLSAETTASDRYWIILSCPILAGLFILVRILIDWEPGDNLGDYTSRQTTAYGASATFKLGSANDRFGARERPLHGGRGPAHLCSTWNGGRYCYLTVPTRDRAE
jgi:hypothetical protein